MKRRRRRSTSGASSSSSNDRDLDQSRTVERSDRHREKRRYRDAEYRRASEGDFHPRDERDSGLAGPGATRPRVRRFWDPPPEGMQGDHGDHRQEFEPDRLPEDYEARVRRSRLRDPGEVALEYGDQRRNLDGTLPLAWRGCDYYPTPEVWTQHPSPETPGHPVHPGGPHHPNPHPAPDTPPMYHDPHALYPGAFSSSSSGLSQPPPLPSFPLYPEPQATQQWGPMAHTFVPSPTLTHALPDEDPPPYSPIHAPLDPLLARQPPPLPPNLRSHSSGPADSFLPRMGRRSPSPVAEAPVLAVPPDPPLPAMQPLYPQVSKGTMDFLDTGSSRFLLGPQSRSPAPAPRTPTLHFPEPPRPTAPRGQPPAAPLPRGGGILSPELESLLIDPAVPLTAYHRTPSKAPEPNLLDDVTIDTETEALWQSLEVIATPSKQKDPEPLPRPSPVAPKPAVTPPSILRRVPRVSPPPRNFEEDPPLGSPYTREGFLREVLPPRTDSWNQEVVDDFRTGMEEDLGPDGVNPRGIVIASLTTIAEESKANHREVVTAIITRLVDTEPKHKPDVWALIDSICRNVGGRYLRAFDEIVLKLVEHQMPAEDERTHQRYVDLVGSWKSLFPEKADTARSLLHFQKPRTP